MFTAWSRQSRSTPPQYVALTDYLSRPVDALSFFETAVLGKSVASNSNYAVRQALDQAYKKYVIEQRQHANEARFHPGPNSSGVEFNKPNRWDLHEDKKVEISTTAKRDFFGRIVAELSCATGADDLGPSKGRGLITCTRKEDQVFVNFHEGYSNAVRKPISLRELMNGL